MFIYLVISLYNFRPIFSGLQGRVFVILCGISIYNLNNKLTLSA